MAVQVKGIDNLRKKFKHIRDAISNDTNQKIKDELGKEAVSLIKIRTSKGNDVDGKPFTKLASSTVAYRRKNKSKLAKGVSPEKSRLTFTGKMIEAVSHKVKNYGFLLFVEGQRNKEIGQYHQSGGGRLPKRKWFGLSTKEVNRLVKYYRQEIKKRL